MLSIVNQIEFGEGFVKKLSQKLMIGESMSRMYLLEYKKFLYLIAMSKV